MALAALKDIQPLDLRHLTVIYRGPLSSCNYGCPYCPFAKHTETAEEHAHDQQQLERFVAWVEAQPFKISVFFTPWGEALARLRYQQAITHLSSLPNTVQLAIQTNLSSKLDWLAQTQKDQLQKIGLWCTYHPAEVKREQFLSKCTQLDAFGSRYSVGVVGKKSHFAEIAALRAALPAQVYLWVNAYSSGQKLADYYSTQDLEFLSRIDPLFEVNTRRYATRGTACVAGEEVISVDGDGTAYRCHFISRPIGNIYADSQLEFLCPRLCSRPRCECHIGYVHLPALEAKEMYGVGLLARIPEGPEWADPQAYLQRARQL